MKAWLLKLHRWVALLFALPLVFLLGTGLILSFEPWLVVRAIEPGSLTPATIQALLSRHDPGGQARALVHRSYDKTLTISAGRGGGTIVDVVTGQALPEPSALASFLLTMRRMHERLLIDAGWLVVASTVAMLVLALLGVLMGLPRIANTLTGWHKATAWGLLPLIVLSPLTGLFLAWGVTFASPPPAAASAQGAPLRSGRSRAHRRRKPRSFHARLDEAARRPPAGPSRRRRRVSGLRGDAGGDDRHAAQLAPAVA